jgi:hypothetical protein
MGGSVGSAPACYGSSQGLNPDISQKYKMVDISKGVANTLTRQKNPQNLRYGKVGYQQVPQSQSRVPVYSSFDTYCEVFLVFECYYYPRLVWILVSSEITLSN